MDWSLLVWNLWHMALAYALALPIAWNREQRERSAGLRTFPLVAVASCAYILIARSALGGDINAQARILQGLVTGIGFVGGGVILKDGDRVRGTATAASVWTMGAIGASVAFDRFELGVLLTIATLATLSGLARMKPDPEDTDPVDSETAPR